MKPTLSAVMLGALTALVSTLGLLPAHAAGAAAPGNPPGISRIVLTDAGGHRTDAAVAGGPERAAAAVRTGALTVDEFLVAGLTWAAGEQLPVGADIKMRVREDGGWSKWLAVESEAASDDPHTRAGTEPLITGGADGVQVVISGSPADLPAHLRLSLISAADDDAPATSSTSSLSVTATEVAATTLATTTPAVVTRAGWGLTADEEDYTTLYWTPKFYPLQAAVVHHTAGTNKYTAGQSAGIVHAIWAFHAQENGWGDIGYNFLVDKYGQMFEGRRHSLPYSVSREVPTGWSIEGAQATSYNKGGLGISAMGDYFNAGAAVANPALVVEPIARLIAWKFNLANLDVVVDGVRDASGYISPGTSSTYPAKTPLPRIFVHKDVSSTLCPGSIANTDIIDAIYTRVQQLDTQAADTTPPTVSLTADKGLVTLTATDDPDAAPPATFYTTDGSKVFYSPDWNWPEDQCGDALVDVTNPRSCVEDTRYTEPFPVTPPTTVSFLAVDVAGNTSAQQSQYIEVEGTVEPSPLEITTTSLAPGEVSVAYNQTLTATGGTSPYTWKVTNLPTGLTLTGDTISGTPTTAGTSTVLVTVTDSAATSTSTSPTLLLAIAPAETPTLVATTFSTVGPDTGIPLSKINLTATLQTTGGVAVSGKAVAFTFNGKTYTATTSSLGVATVKVSTPRVVRDYPASVTFAGDSTYEPTSAGWTITITK